MALDPSLSRRDAELMYERYLDRKEKQGASYRGCCRFPRR